MKTKVIVLALAGLGLTTALMAGGPRGDCDGARGERGQHGMYQQGERGERMHRRGHRQGRGMWRKHRQNRMGFLRQMGRKLDLTSDQRQKIRALATAERQARKAEYQGQHRQGKQRAGLFGTLNPETFMSADHFDKEAFKKAVKAQAEKRRAERKTQRESRLDHRADFMAKFFDILTPEQRVKWLELVKEK